MGKWKAKIPDTQGEAPTKPTKPVLMVLKVPDPRHFRKKNAPETGNETRRLWLVRHGDGSLVSHSFCPPVTLAKVREWYPDAKSIEADEQPAMPEPHREHGRTKKNPGREWKHQHWRIIPQDASKPEFVRDFGYPVSMSHVLNEYPDAMITAAEDATVTEQEAANEQ